MERPSEVTLGGLQELVVSRALEALEVILGAILKFQAEIGGMTIHLIQVCSESRLPVPGDLVEFYFEGSDGYPDEWRQVRVAWRDKNLIVRVGGNGESRGVRSRGWRWPKHS